MVGVERMSGGEDSCFAAVDVRYSELEGSWSRRCHVSRVDWWVYGWTIRIVNVWWLNFLLCSCGYSDSDLILEFL